MTQSLSEELESAEELLRDELLESLDDEDDDEDDDEEEEFAVFFFLR